MAGPVVRRGVVVWTRRAGIAALALGLVYLVISIWDYDAFVRWMNGASALPFFVAMAVLPAIGVPVSPFLIVAGATFGVVGGLTGSIIAIACNLCIVYAIAHSKIRPRIVSLFDRFGYKVPDFAGGGRAAWRFTVALKLTPGIPQSAKAYVTAITAVPFWIYFGGMLGISSLFAVAWIALGDSLLTHDLNHATLAAIALAVLAIVAVMWWRKRRGVTGETLSAV